MRSYSKKFIIFFLSIFLGILISSNSNFNGIKKYFSLDFREYNDAAIERNDLYKKISSLEKANKKNTDLIESYKNSNSSNTKEVIKLMKEQTEYYGMLTGSVPVEGPGILLKINDGDIYNKDNNSVEIANKIFHDRDVQLVINELKKAGAEAIMINNYRLTPTTGLSCNGPFIIFQDEHTEYAPFYIYAIGNPEEMEAAILSEESHIRQLQLRELSIEIEKMDNIKMPAASNEVKSEYMKETVENKDKK